MSEEQVKMFLVEEGTNRWIGHEEDLDLGFPKEHTFNFIYKYIVEREAVEEERVLRTYPNGGMDVEYVEISPEEGHWEIETTDNVPLNWPIDDEIVEYLDKNRANEVSIQGYLWHWYNEEEKEEYREKKEAFEREQQKFDLQKQLDNSDFIAAKFVDRLLTLDDLNDLPTLVEEFREKYSTTLELRQSQRVEINKLKS